MATYTGENETGHHTWQIDGLTYTGSVSTVGGGTPVVGRAYPAWCNQPDSRSQWVALVRAGSSKILTKEFTPEVAQWLRYLADQGRTSRTAATVAELARTQPLIDRFETDVIVAVRVYDGKVYVNTLSGWIVELAPGATYDIFDFLLPTIDAGSQPIDWAMDADEDGNHFLLMGGAGSIVKAERASSSVLWTSASFGSGFSPMAGSLALTNVSQPLVIALSLKARAINLHARKRSDGSAVTTAALTQTEDAPFATTPAGDATGETVLRYSGAAGQAWAWDPASLPSWTWATGYITGPPAQQWHPWAGIFTGDQAASVYPGQPSGRLSPTSTTLPYWGATAAGPYAGPLTPKQILGSLSDGKIVVPMARYVPTLPFYNPDGSVAAELKGWETTPSAGEHHYRDFFCPLMIYAGKLLSTTRRVTLLELDYSAAVRVTTSVDFYDETITLSGGEHPYYGTQITYTPESPLPPRRMRIVVGVEDRFEVFRLADFSRQVSVPFHTDKLTSLFHTLGEHVGILPPPFWSHLEDTTYVPPYDGPTYLDLYGPEGYDLATYDQDPRPLGDYYIDANLGLCISKTGIAGTYESGAPQLRSFFRWEATERESMWDPPAVLNLLGPILSSNKTLIIYPQNGTNGLSLFSTTLTPKKRAWAAGSNAFSTWTGGNQGNSWQHTLELTGSRYQTAARRIWEARRWDGSVAWEHTLELTGTVTSLDFRGGQCCGGGRLIILYTLNGTRRLRAVNDSTGALVEDIALTIGDGTTPGTPRQTILCGGVAIIVTDGSIHEILPA